jgi:formamidopyrimidine-DNA glycosylase
MPELPEVEITRRGIAPHLVGRTIASLVVRERRLRWPVPEGLEQRLVGLVLTAVERRGKYLLLRSREGGLIVHLGMSGSLRIVHHGEVPSRHDHLDLRLSDGACLRLRDPRRFGCFLWAEGDPLAHPLLAELGPEPFDPRFSGDHLHHQAAGRRTAVKSFLMDSRVVVGVGNIYANEALFLAGIDPRRSAGRISLRRYQLLASCVREVLRSAIEHGGTTLRDFVDGGGNPGYFQRELLVYGKSGGPCRGCGEPLRSARIGQRSTFYCPRCQR